MTRSTSIMTAALAALAALGPWTAVAADGDWTPMTAKLIGPATPSPGDPGAAWVRTLQDNTIRTVAANNGERTYLAMGRPEPLAPGQIVPEELYGASLTDGNRRLRVEALAGPPPYCDEGPNGVGAARNYARCPGEVVIARPDHEVVVPVRRMCIAPEGGANPNDRTYARYDASNHQVLMATYNGRKSVPECQITIVIPTP